MAFMVRHIRKLSRSRVVAQKTMIPGSAACKVTQAGNLTEKWHFHPNINGIVAQLLL
ncbi:MAG: hypothetical protein V3V90_04125 [Thermodesulfobacteriota bacterium]